MWMLRNQLWAWAYTATRTYIRTLHPCSFHLSRWMNLSSSAFLLNFSAGLHSVRLRFVADVNSFSRWIIIACKPSQCGADQSTILVFGCLCISFPSFHCVRHWKMAWQSLLSLALIVVKCTIWRCEYVHLKFQCTCVPFKLNSPFLLVALDQWHLISFTQIVNYSLPWCNWNQLKSTNRVSNWTFDCYKVF